MSDTPKTDELISIYIAKRDFVPDGLWIRLARELERENAALREDKELLDSNTIWLNVDGQPVWFNGCDLRKAIRRAMKEAGDDDIMRQHLNEGGTPT